jgi:hypothetical protein
MPRLRSIRFADWRPLFVALAFQLMAVAAAAQEVRVTVRDGRTGAPVAAAMVRVEDAAGVTARAGFTRADGTVRLRLRAGEYSAFVRRAGYLETSVPLRVGAGDNALEVTMRPRPFVLDTVRVVAQGEGEERGRDAFLRRSLTEDGVFLDPAYLTQRYHSRYISDLLYGVPDVVVMEPTCLGHSRGKSPWAGCAGRLSPRKPISTRGWGCFTVLLNGRPPEMGSFDPDYGHDEIDFWYRPRDMVGVEVYHVPSQIPQDLRRFSEPHCGMINYWTRNRW